MKILTSYFYQIRNFKPYQIPLSTAISDPAWYHPKNGDYYVDKNGVINGLRIGMLQPQRSLGFLCGGKTCTQQPDSCRFLRAYYDQLCLTISVISYYVSYAFITDDTVLIRQRSLMILDTCRYIFCLIVGAYWIINNWKKDSYYRFRLIPNQYEIVTLLDVSNLGMLDDQINPYGNDFIKTEKDIYISLAETPLRSKHYVDLVVESNDKVNNVYTCKDLKIIDNKIGRERFAFVFSIILSIWVMILSVLLGYLATHIALPYTRAENSISEPVVRLLEASVLGLISTWATMVNTSTTSKLMRILWLIYGGVLMSAAIFMFIGTIVIFW